MNKQPSFQFHLHQNGTIIFKGDIAGESFEVKVPKSEVLNPKTIESFQGQYYPTNTGRGGWFDMLTGKFPLSQEKINECQYQYKLWNGVRGRKFKGCYIKKIEHSILAFFCITLYTEKTAQEVYEQAYFMKQWDYKVPYILIYHKGIVYVFNTLEGKITNLVQYKKEVDALYTYEFWKNPLTDFKKTGETWEDYTSYVGITSSERSARFYNSNMIYLLRNAICSARDRVATTNGPKKSIGEKLEEEFYDALHTPLPNTTVFKNMWDCVMSRYKDLLIITCHADGFGRFILNGTKNFAYFVKQGDGWYYEKFRVRNLYNYDLIEWDAAADIAKGTIYEPICRIKHFGDIGQQVGILLHYYQYLRGQFADNMLPTQQYLQAFTAFFDNDLLYEAYRQGSGRGLISTYQTKVSLLTTNPWIRRVTHPRQAPFTNSYDWYKVNKHQIGKLIELLKQLKQTNGRGGYYQGLTLYSASSEFLNFEAKFWYNDEEADLRPLSDKKFDLLFDWVMELNDYPWPCYSGVVLSNDVDKEAMINFWRKEGYKPNDLRNWRDTIQMMRQVTNEELKPSVMKIRLRDLRTIHDRLVTQLQEFKSRSAQEKWEIQKPKWEKYLYEDSEYKIIIPEKPEDLSREGTLLQHCVGSYIDRVANGADIILFMRKKEKLNEPFYTLNLSPDGKQLIQVHGHHDKWPAMNPEILPFLDKWVAKFKFQGWEGIRNVKRDHY